MKQQLLGLLAVAIVIVVGFPLFDKLVLSRPAEVSHATALGVIWLWPTGAVVLLFASFARYASWFIRYRDIGPPRLLGSTLPFAFAVLQPLPMAYWRSWWGFSLFWAFFFCAVGADIWLDERARRKEQTGVESLDRGPGGRTVRILTDLSLRLVGTDGLLLPRSHLDRLSDAEVDAILARQAAPQSFVLLISLGTVLVPVSLAVLRFVTPLVFVAEVLCLWALIVWVHRRLDAQADAKAIQATGDPATYIQALVKADRLMQEIPRRLRMSTWWLFPASLEARIGAITRARTQGAVLK